MTFADATGIDRLAFTNLVVAYRFLLQDYLGYMKVAGHNAESVFARIGTA